MALPAPFVPPVTSAVRTHRGRAEIDAWIDDTIDLSTTTVTLLGARTVDDMVGASYRLEGDFPGGSSSWSTSSGSTSRAGSPRWTSPPPLCERRAVTGCNGCRATRRGIRCCVGVSTRIHCIREPHIVGGAVVTHLEGGTATRGGVSEVRVLIAGGRGRVGSKVADLLETHGVEVVSGGLADGVDYIEGTRVPEVMEGVDTIVNVLNTSRFDEDGAVSFFDGTTRALTAGGAAAGVRHHVLLSIVGVGDGDASDVGYYVGKVAQERALKAGAIPYTIVRSTQFQSYIPVLADQYTAEGVVLAPRDLIQPVELDELVALLVEVVLSGAPLGEVEIAGPELFHLDDLFRGTLAAAGDSRDVVTIETAGAEDAMVPRGEYRVGRTRYPIRGIPLAN